MLEVPNRKIAAKELALANEEVHHANQAKSTFLANMSHEIRTPLGAILGFAKLMKEAATDKERAEYSAIIDRNGKVLTKIIDDILDLSKVEAGRLETIKIAFEIRSLISEVKDLFTDIVLKKGISFNVEFDSQIPKIVKSDPKRIRQILVNLIDNAVKFTEKGMIRIKVTPLFAHGSISQLQFKIQDTGVGLLKDQVGKLFASFTQGDNSMTRKYGGTGLGLILSRRLANALGGDVWLHESIPNQGSIFLVTVNVYAGDERNADKTKSNLEKGLNKSDSVRVLLVEDSVDNQLLVEKVLCRAGMKVKIAKNGLEAVRKARAGNFDVILMDMQMPVLDGYSATRCLRKSGYNKPVIALTAHAMADEMKRTHQAGCDAHLTKPVDFEVLVKTVSSFAQGYHHNPSHH